MSRLPRAVATSVLSLGLLLVMALPALASSGSPDPTFGTNGFVLTSFDTMRRHTLSYGLDQAIQPDGKIVVAGVTSLDQPTPSYDVVVLRYLTGGTLDPTFGVGGVKRVSVGGSVSMGGMAIDQDGRILVDGAANGTGFVIRLTATGAPDHTFGGTGTVLLSPPGHTFTEVRDLLIVEGAEPLLVGGAINGSSEDLMLGRLLPSGSPDPSFGSGGYAFLHAVDGITSGFTAALAPRGRIVAAGWVWPTGGPISAAAFRFTADGAPDPTFSGDGIDTFVMDGASTTEPVGIVVRSGGLVILSRVITASGSGLFGLMALRRRGGIDTTFGGGAGQEQYDPITAADIPRDVVQQVDGSLVMVGESQGIVLLIRVSSAGVPDASFGSNGVVIEVPDPSAYSAATSVSLQIDGKIVVSGHAGNKIYVGRFLA